MCPQPDEQANVDFKIQLEQGKQIPVHVFGHGKQLLIAIHGYDYDGTVYQSWATQLGEQYTICAPDLPFHGETQWDERQFTPPQIVALIRAIAEHQKATSFTLAGHSLGARILLCTAPGLWQSVDQYIFLAPAGIGSFDRVIPRWMQSIVEGALARPFWLKTLVNLGARLGIVSNFRRRYAEVQLYPPGKRFRLFRTYNSLVHLRTSRPDRVAYWKQNTVKTQILLATQDRFVPNERIKAYFASVPEVSWQQLPGGHDLVHEASAKAILAAVQIP
ncbi:MAG: alpha/beta hydrolase [Bacteroidota bacterium]